MVSTAYKTQPQKELTHWKTEMKKCSKIQAKEKEIEKMKNRLKQIDIMRKHFFFKYWEKKISQHLLLLR